MPARDVDLSIERSERDARAILEALRDVVTTTVPNAEETISWGAPFYRHHGPLAGFAAYASHVSFGCGGKDLAANYRELLERQGYKTGKKTFQIRFGQKVPVGALRRLLKARARANERAAQH
jgi:uncharacterized protein